MPDQSSSNSSSNRQPSRDSEPVLGMHRGALDSEMVTNLAPIEVMKRVDKTLQKIGIQLNEESTYKYRCIRPKRVAVEEGGGVGGPTLTGTVLYGATESDMGDEVRFSMELTSLPNLPGMHSLDIRRLKGNLRSYKFLYDTIRDIVALKSPKYED